MSKLDIYDIGNYFPFHLDVGIYDFHEESSELVQKLKVLPFKTKLVVNGELLDSLSYKVYETEKLWWVLALYNDIIDPLNFDNLEISIPDINDIESILIDIVEKLKRSR